MSWFSSSLLLVFVQVSVSSSWRFAQTANTETKPMTVANTTSAIGTARCVLALGESMVYTPTPVSPGEPAVYVSDRRDAERYGQLGGPVSRGPCRLARRAPRGSSPIPPGPCRGEPPAPS